MTSALVWVHAQHSPMAHHGLGDDPYCRDRPAANRTSTGPPSAEGRPRSTWRGLSVEHDLRVDDINEMVSVQYPGTGNYCIEVGRDHALAGYRVVDTDIRPGGFVSGPTQFGLADCALWFVAFVALGRIEPMALTSELSIRFLRPAQGTTLFARATMDAVSRRSVVGTVNLWCDDQVDRITATAQGTYALPLPR